MSKSRTKADIVWELADARKEIRRLQTEVARLSRKDDDRIRRKVAKQPESESWRSIL